METALPERTNSAPRSELAALFAAAIRRLLEREALTSPISPELSASRLDVPPQTGLNGQHGESPAWLIKRIAWPMQANHEGGLTERARQRARELACDADLRLSAPRMRPQPVSVPAAPRNPSRCRKEAVHGSQDPASRPSGGKREKGSRLCPWTSVSGEALLIT